MLYELWNEQSLIELVNSYLRAYTMDVVWNCAFGVDIDCQKDTENKFFRKGVQMFEDLSNMRWNFLIASTTLSPSALADFG